MIAPAEKKKRKEEDEDEDENGDHLPPKMSTCCVMCIIVYECVYVFVAEIVGAEGERWE